jgi:hypothetical protein
VVVDVLIDELCHPIVFWSSQQPFFNLIAAMQIEHRVENPMKRVGTKV